MPRDGVEWIGALVEPPIAEQATIAFSNAARVRISDGFRSSRTISTARTAGLVGDLAALAVWRRYGGAAGQRHAERLGQRIHGRRRAHGVAMADRRRRRRDDVDEFLVVDLAGSDVLARLPDHGAGASELAVVVAVEHRPAGQHDRRRVDGRGGHQASRRGLVAAGHQHHAVERIAVQHFDKAEISEIAVERRGRPLAGFLNRMHRKFQRHAAGIANALAHAFGEFEMMAIARAEIGAGLRNADDRPAGCQFGARKAVIEVALQIKRGHARIIRIVEP